MFYQLYEFNHAAMQPYRAYADAVRLFYSNPLNPFSHTPFGPLRRGRGRTVRAHHAPLRQAGFRPERPSSTGRHVAVAEKIVWSRPFCNLIHFVRDLPAGRKADPKLLIVAPMSGHYATLLRGTVEAMLPHADVYITDWTDARMVPLTARAASTSTTTSTMSSTCCMCSARTRMSWRSASRPCRCLPPSP